FSKRATVLFLILPKSANSFVISKQAEFATFSKISPKTAVLCSQKNKSTPQNCYQSHGVVSAFSKICNLRRFQKLVQNYAVVFRERLAKRATPTGQFACSR
ncbi:MAG: hypothetical protein ACI4QH_02450, partial [Candidatus Fimimonas sp.]